MDLIAQFRKLLAALPPGPWWRESHGEFISFAVTNLPAVLDRLERLETAGKAFMEAGPDPQALTAVAEMMRAASTEAPMSDERMAWCDGCGGTGKGMGPMGECGRCGGDGVIPEWAVPKKCPKCGARGVAFICSERGCPVNGGAAHD